MSILRIDCSNCGDPILVSLDQRGNIPEVYCIYCLDAESLRNIIARGAAKQEKKE